VLGRSAKIFGKTFVNIWEGIKNTAKGVVNFIIGVMNKFLGGLERMLNNAIDGINKLIKLLNKVPGVKIKKLRDVDIPKIPSFQTGGIMPHTGLAYLHAGERVVPKSKTHGDVIFAPMITINAEVSSEYDVRQLANDLNKYWVSDFERAIKGRSI
jgi:hypothetical protein